MIPTYAVISKSKTRVIAMFRAYGQAADWAEERGFEVINITHPKNKGLVKQLNLDAGNLDRRLQEIERLISKAKKALEELTNG